MSVEEVFRVLAGEPYHLSPAEIGNLSPHQVRAVYFRKDPRDESGSSSSPAANFYARAREVFYKVHQDWKGLPKEEVDRLWAEHVAKAPEFEAFRPGFAGPAK